jgi:di/tricarboxylate transporter
MDIQLVVTFAIAIIALGLLVSDRLRPDLVALMVVVALGVSGILTPREAFSGFSRSAVITIMAIFVLAEGLQRTGVIERVGDLLLRVAGEGEGRLVVVVMLAGAFLSLFMNNIAAASVLMPAVAGAARKARVSPARLMMPLAFATILGGMATLLTTTNIVVSSLLRDEGLAGYGLLDFAPVGLPLVVAGVAYMVLWGRHRLPAHLPTGWIGPDPLQDDLVEVYRLGERLFWARVPAGSDLVDKPLNQSAFRERYNLSVVAVERAGKVICSPAPDLVLGLGDVVLLAGKIEDLRQENLGPNLEILPPREWSRRDLESPEVVVAEAVLAPRSTLIGQTLRQAHFREKYGMAVLAIWRAGRPIRTALGDLALQFGDALLLQGPRGQLPLLRSEPDLIVLGDARSPTTLPRRKGWLALSIVATTLVLAAIDATLVGEVMLGGAVVMILARLLTMDQAYQAIEWKSVFLVAGMLPLGVAMTKTGAAALLADRLIAVLGPAGPLAMLAGLFLLATVLTQGMNGAAVASVVAPMAIQAAQQLGIDPRALAMGVALATSLAFVTPLGHPVNVLVMGPGGYRFRDYVRVGLPLVLLLFALVLLLLPLFWPLGLQ